MTKTWLFFFLASLASIKGQRLSQGASDWYMRFHNNFDYVKRNVDRPVIKSFNVTSKVHHRFALTSVVVVVSNPATSPQPYNFGFVMPKEALVSNVTIQRSTFDNVVTSTLFPSDLMSHFVNESNVESKEDDLSLDSEMVTQASFHQFVLPIELMANDDTKITLEYGYLLKRNDDKYRHTISLSPGEIVKDFQVHLSIVDNHRLKSVSVTAPVIGSILQQQENTDQLLDQFQASFNMSEVEQYHYFNSHGFTGDLVTEFSLDNEHDELDIVIEDDIFVHFYNGPQEAIEQISSHVVFLVDLSSTLIDEKLAMAKEALTILLKSLAPKDLFNIVVFNGQLGKEPQDWQCQEGLKFCNESHLKAAIEFINQLTNEPIEGDVSSHDLSDVLDHAMTLGLKMSLPDNVISRVVLLTDGAERSSFDFYEDKLPFVVIGLGSDAPMDLLEEAVAYEADDITENVIEGLAVEDQLQTVIKHLKGIVLKDINLRYFSDSDRELKVTGNWINFLRQGSSVVVSGLLDAGEKLATVEITAQSSTGNYVKKIAFVPSSQHLGCKASATLCTERHFKGNCKTVDSSQNRLKSTFKTAKKAASAKIEGTCPWIVYTRANFKGQTATLSPGAYEILPTPSNKLVASILVTRDSNQPSSQIASKIWSYLTVQDAFEVDFDPELAKITYQAAEKQNFLTPYTSIQLGLDQVVTFKDLNPVFFQTSDPEVDPQLVALKECQKPVDCTDNFHYQLNEDDQQCTGSLTLFTGASFDGENLDVSQSLDQLFHSVNGFRFHSFQSTGDCCWLLFKHRFFAGNVEKICGDSQQPLWKQNIGSIKRIGQLPATDNV